MKKLSILLLILCSFSVLKAQDWAVNQLNDSPRHHEWVKIKSGNRNVSSFVVYPEVSKKSTVVIAIHENRGLTDWVRSFADQLAAEGYIVIAPDLLSEFNNKISGTKDFATSDDARNGIYALDQKQVEQDLNAVQDYAEQLKAGNGKTVVAGFCWGGSQSFKMASYNNDIKAALVFYGSAPDSAAIQKISVPVYGFYGENDQRINSGIPETERLMNKAGKKYKYEIYDGAGHAYMRQGDDPQASEASKKARDKSWQRILAILEKI